MYQAWESGLLECVAVVSSQGRNTKELLRGTLGDPKPKALLILFFYCGIDK